MDLAPVIAPLPECLQERGIAAPGLLAQVLAGKYCDHLPLYRQEQIFLRRHQVHLPRQTLARWVALAADWLKPIYEHIRTGVMAGGYVQVDETPVNYLEPGNGRTRQGYFWTGSRPGGRRVFPLGNQPRHRVPGPSFPRTSPARCNVMATRPIVPLPTVVVRTIELAGCWAHVRRKFYEAIETSPKIGGLDRPSNPTSLPGRSWFA
jgi:transposase